MFSKYNNIFCMINKDDERLPTYLHIVVTGLQGSSVYQEEYMESSLTEFYSRLDLANTEK